MSAINPDQLPHPERDLDDDAIERVLEAFTDYFTTRTI